MKNIIRKNGSYTDPSSLDSNGFVIVRSVLDEAEINYVRRIILKEIESLGKPRKLMPRHVIPLQDVWSLMFKREIVSVLKEALGESLVYIPDLTVQWNNFGYEAWHVDSGSELMHPYLQEEDYKFVKCGIYFQDNSESWGGGIQVAPGGHKYPINSSFPKINRKIKSLLNRIQVKINPVTLDIRSGDFLFFDARLPHSSTFPSVIRKPKTMGNNYHFPEIADENSKLVFYWDACNILMKNNFMENSKRRSLVEETSAEIWNERGTENIGIERGEIFFSDYIRMFYPDSYSLDFVEATRLNGIKMASLTKSECQHYNEAFRTLHKETTNTLSTHQISTRKLSKDK